MPEKLVLVVKILLVVVIAACISYGPGASATVPYTNTRADLDGSGAEANAASGIDYGPVSVSANGRYVAFSSYASNLVAGDTNSREDIFVKDNQTGTVTRANVTSAGAQAPKGAYDSVSISANGRYVVFASDDTTLGTIYFINQPHLFVHDMQTGTTKLVSNPSSKIVPNSFQISGNGRYVVYLEDADGVVSADSNHAPDVYLKDLKTNSLTLMSKNSSGVVSNLGARSPSIDYSGSKVAFSSYSSNLISGTTMYHTDTYLIDRIEGDTMSDVTFGSNGDSSQITALSGDGNTLLFASSASNLVSGYSGQNVFAYNIANNSMQVINVDSSGVHHGQTNPFGLAANSDGTLIVFGSTEDHLVTGDTNNSADIFLRNLNTGTTERVSMRNSTTQTTTNSTQATISSDGKTIGFVSADTGLVTGDTNSVADIFLASSGTSTCTN